MTVVEIPSSLLDTHKELEEAKNKVAAAEGNVRQVVEKLSREWCSIVGSVAFSGQVVGRVFEEQGRLAFYGLYGEDREGQTSANFQEAEVVDTLGNCLVVKPSDEDIQTHHTLSRVIRLGDMVAVELATISLPEPVRTA